VTNRSAAQARGRQVAEDRLLRATSLLQAVTPAERAAIEETAYAIAAKVADCILDEAPRCAPLAAALTAKDPKQISVTSR
jgi:hypothetical protein